MPSEAEHVGPLPELEVGELRQAAELHHGHQRNLKPPLICEYADREGSRSTRTMWWQAPRQSSCTTATLVTMPTVFARTWGEVCLRVHISFRRDVPAATSTASRREGRWRMHSNGQVAMEGVRRCTV